MRIDPLLGVPESGGLIDKSYVLLFELDSELPFSHLPVLP